MNLAIKELFDSGYEYAQIVAENIRVEAARRSMNQSDIARKLGLKPATISLRWNGRRSWPIEDIGRIADVFGIEPWQLSVPSNYNPDTRNGTQPKPSAVPDSVHRLGLEPRTL
ncbi:helix-turn-helix transcriptional regulator [Arcanobacterium hippocoleae]